jgi:hypothetical protein
MSAATRPGQLGGPGGAVVTRRGRAMGSATPAALGWLVTTRQTPLRVHMRTRRAHLGDCKGDGRRASLARSCHLKVDSSRCRNPNPPALSGVRGPVVPCVCDAPGHDAEAVAERTRKSARASRFGEAVRVPRAGDGALLGREDSALHEPGLHANLGRAAAQADPVRASQERTLAAGARLARIPGPIGTRQARQRRLAAG